MKHLPTRAALSAHTRAWKQLVILPPLLALALPLLFSISSAVPALATSGAADNAATSVTVAHYMTFLPMLRSGAPDLVITRISMVPSQTTFAAGEPAEVRVTVKNQGAAAESFWVDLYINPSSPPTAANQIWNTRCTLTPCFGMAWQVTSGLAAGQSITLSSLSLPPVFSSWPGYFAAGTSDLYAYADSFNIGVPAGAVAESDETNNRAELHGLSVTGPNPPLVGEAVKDIPLLR